MLVLGLVVALAYLAVALAAAAVHFRGSAELSFQADDGLPPVAVVVAARNEENTVASCLRALLAQDYPADKLTIVVVDDYSEDETAARVREVARRHTRVRLIDSSATGEMRGKASALALGVDESQSEIVLTTDADCTPLPGWVRGMTTQLLCDELVAVGGPTMIRTVTMFDRLQALDWMLGFAVAGAASDVGYPITAMGNNMAFDRAAYNAIGGYRRFSSSHTEDYQLFKAFGARSPGVARLVLNRELLVFTEPVPTLRQAFVQRRRWARGGLRTSTIGYLMYLVAWSAHALPLVLLPVAPPAALTCFAFKLAADAAVVAACGKRLRHPPPWDAFVGFEVFLTGYVVLMPLSLILIRRHTWKGRAISGYGISGAGES